MEPQEAESILNEHLRLSSDLHELLLEEGSIMRSTGLPPDEAFLKRKQSFLAVLDKGLSLLKRINQEPDSIPKDLGTLVEQARSQILKLMMLDRENERLLLKASLPPTMKQAYSKAAPGQVAKAYAKFAEGKPVT